MFKNTTLPHLNRKSVAGRLSQRQILEFSLAEFSSAIEMLHAAKNTEDPILQRGLINHALDEYSHTKFFINLMATVKSQNVQQLPLKFSPTLCLSLGYLRPKEFLCESLTFQEFTAFVAINEANALKIFRGIRPSVEAHHTDILRQLDVIIEEEITHLNSVKHGSNPSEGFNNLLADEKKHSNLAAAHLKKITTTKQRRALEFRFKAGNKFRHIWGRQLWLKALFENLFCFIVISLIILLRRALKLPRSNNDNLFDPAQARNML